jgi:hypothetical protein
MSRPEGEVKILRRCRFFCKFAALRLFRLWLLTGRFRVRFLFGEPSLFATSPLRLLVDGGQARTPLNGQYTGESALPRRAHRGARSSRTARWRLRRSTFSPSPARAALLVNWRAEGPLTFGDCHPGIRRSGSRGLPTRHQFPHRPGARIRPLRTTDGGSRRILIALRAKASLQGRPVGAANPTRLM